MATPREKQCLEGSPGAGPADVGEEREHDAESEKEEADEDPRGTSTRLLPPCEFASSDATDMPDMTYRSSSSRTLLDSPLITPPNNRHSALYLLHDSDYDPSPSPEGPLGSLTSSPCLPPDLSSSSSPSEATRAGRRINRGFRTTGTRPGQEGQRLALGDLLVHMLSRAFLNDEEEEERQYGSGWADSRRKRKRHRDEQDDEQTDREAQADFCRTSTPMSFIGGGDDGYEGDVSMSDSRMRAVIPQSQVQNQAVLRDRDGCPMDLVSFGRLAVDDPVIDDRQHAVKRQRRRLGTPRGPRADTSSDRPLLPLSHLPIPVPVPLRGWYWPPQLPNRPKAALPTTMHGKRLVRFADTSVGLPYAGDEECGTAPEYNTKAPAGSCSNRQLCATVSTASSSQSEHRLPVLSPPRHRRPLTRYDDLASPVRVSSRRRKRETSPPSPLVGRGRSQDRPYHPPIDDATVIAVAAAAQRTARAESPMKVMWDRYTRGRDHWSPPLSLSRSNGLSAGPDDRQGRGAREGDHWSPSPPPPSPRTRSRSSRSRVRDAGAGVGDHWSPPDRDDTMAKGSDAPISPKSHYTPRSPSCPPPPPPPREDASQDQDSRRPCRRRRVRYSTAGAHESRSSRRAK